MRVCCFNYLVIVFFVWLLIRIDNDLLKKIFVLKEVLKYELYFINLYVFVFVFGVVFINVIGFLEISEFVVD